MESTGSDHLVGEAAKMSHASEPKFCDIEELFEGFGREKLSRTDAVQKRRFAKDSKFLKSLSRAFGTSPADIAWGQKMVDIVSAGYSEMSERELCEQLLSQVQNSLQSSASCDSASNSGQEPLLLRLHKFLSSQMKEMSGIGLKGEDSMSALPTTGSAGDSFNSVSSLGILNLSDMSDFTGEDIGRNDESYQFCDNVEYLNEIEELQHHNKKLSDENGLFKSQLATSEEVNQLLIQENEKLKKEIKNLQENLSEIKELQLKNENLRCSLLNSENNITDLSCKLEEMKKENELLQNDLHCAALKLESSQLDAESKQRMLTCLTESHQQQKTILQNLYREKDAAERELNEITNKKQDLETAIQELNDANQSLRHDKHLVEIELEKTKQRLECAIEKQGMGGSELSLGSPSSTPRRYNVGPSICCEMSSIISFSENLPTPFCGKMRRALTRRHLYSLMSSVTSSPMRKKAHSDAQKHRTFAASHSVKRLCVSTPAASNRMRHKKFCKLAYSKPYNNNESFSEEPISSPEVSPAIELRVPDNKRKYDYEDASESERSYCGAFDNSFENLYMRHVHGLLASMVKWAEEVNIQAKQGLGLNLDLLETKLIEAEKQSGCKIDLKTTEESNMPPQEQLSGIEQDEKLVYDLASNDIQHQICAELKALKTQLVRSHALFSYLEKEKYASASPDLFSEKIVDNQQSSKIHLLQQKSFDAHTSSYFPHYSNKDSSSIASHRSTPLHHSHRTQSCPTFIDDLSFAHKSTQTEFGGDSDISSRFSNKISGHPPKFISAWNHNKEPRYSECSSTSEVSSKSAENLECGVCEVHHLQKDSLSPRLPRHRTNSFLSAVAQANNQSASCDTDSSRSNITPEYSQTFDGRRRSSTLSRRVVKIAEHEEQKEKMSKENTVPEEGTVNDKNDKAKNDKEKSFKMSQRSMRRSSGAGSPNSLTSIPRYPAFDLDEQDEEHTLSITIPNAKKSTSPSEPSIKAQVTEVIQTSVPQPKESLHTIKESTRGKSDHSRATLMPEVMENSETESAKGSFEYESFDPQTAISEGPPIPVPNMAFPNLPNSLLTKLGVSKDTTYAVESYDEQELENKFMTLSLAFKTDKMTLSKRLEIQKRQRDIAEKDVENEIKAIKESLSHLNLNATTSETRDLIAKIQTHVDIVSLATSKVSARSETYGAVKQEERVSCAFEVMMHHVENLRRLFDKEHRELEETKRILSGTQVSQKKISSGEIGGPEEHKKSLKTFGLAIGTVKSVVRRRASVADFHSRSLQESFTTSRFSQSWASGIKDTRSRLISALTPFSSSSSVGLNSTSSSTHLCTSVVPSSQLSSPVTGSRRCSLPASSLSGSPLPPKASESRVKDAFHLGRSPSEMKISVAPSLSSVVDEEHSEEEEEEKKNEESPLIEHDELINTLPSVPNNEYEWSLENSPERQHINEVMVQQDVTDSSDEGTADVSADIKRTTITTILQRIGFPHILHFWNETSAFNLIRYVFSFLLGLSAFIILVATFLPSESCSANEEYLTHVLQKLRQLMLHTARQPPVV